MWVWLLTKGSVNLLFSNYLVCACLKQKEWTLGHALRPYQHQKYQNSDKYYYDTDQLLYQFFLNHLLATSSCDVFNFVFLMQTICH